MKDICEGCVKESTCDNKDNARAVQKKIEASFNLRNLLKIGFSFQVVCLKKEEKHSES